jgi:hypothetical protein
VVQVQADHGRQARDGQGKRPSGAGLRMASTDEGEGVRDEPGKVSVSAGPVCPAVV